MAPLNLTGIYVPGFISAILRSKLEIIKEVVLLLEIYDYIIVGSGPGGSMVANRLAQDNNTKILILEAGGKDNVTSEIPFLSSPMIRGGYDWMYETTPQERACLGMIDKKCVVASGKVVGGSSALGFTIHNRGNEFDFEEWSNLGNTGWSYKDVLPYFKKYEDFKINGECVKDDYHGCGGELYINRSTHESGIPEEMISTKYFMNGAKELGFETTDFDIGKQIGVNYGQYRIKDGVRQSAATAFLRPIQNKSNVHILLNALVHKILFNPETKTVTGVEFEKDGVIQQVNVKKEIILSAGTYSSPKILMLSGIGPKEELEKFKIPVIVDLPGVGQNLQELAGGQLPLTTGQILTEEEQNLMSVSTIRKWRDGIGLLTSPSAYDAYLYVKSNYSEKNYPDLMLLFQSLSFYSIVSPFLKREFGFTDEFWKIWYEDYEDREFANIQPILLHPKSKGTVKLRSGDAHDFPVIDPNYFAEEDDRKVLIEGFRLAEKLATTKLFQEKDYKIRSRKVKNCKDFDMESDDYINCLYQQFTFPLWCGCCTNKMGPETDKLAVVDNRLRVRGVKGLRVVDASVFPQTVSGFPTATIYMVGEKAAEMIKEDN